MSESNKSLEELIEKSNYFWLKEETTDASYKFNKSEFEEFLSKSLCIRRYRKWVYKSKKRFSSKGASGDIEGSF